MQRYKLSVISPKKTAVFLQDNTLIASCLPHRSRRSLEEMENSLVYLPLDGLRGLFAQVEEHPVVQNDTGGLATLD
jgi:hypothetical protein